MEVVNGDKLKEYVGERLLAVRKELGLTRAEVANKSGVSSRTLYTLEKAENFARIDTLMALSVTYGIPLEMLLPPIPCEIIDSPRNILKRLKNMTSEKSRAALLDDLDWL